MTREEAKEIPCLYSTFSVKIKYAIDKIYDDFESRTCENCKWYTGYSCGISAYEFPCSEDFGCNKFEAK